MTGLSTQYDIELVWESAGPPPGGDLNVLSAVQSQLGLRVETMPVPVEFIVVDRANRVPIPN